MDNFFLIDSGCRSIWLIIFIEMGVGEIDMSGLQPLKFGGGSVPGVLPQAGDIAAPLVLCGSETRSRWRGQCWCLDRAGALCSGLVADW